MPIKTYRDLKAWQRGMELVVEVYRLTESFPKCEQFGLVSQIQRAAVSIPSNIAEGHGRLSRKDFLRYLSIARGSVMEVETQIQIAHRLGYVERDACRPVWHLSQEVGRILGGLIRSLRQSPESIKLSEEDKERTK